MACSGQHKDDRLKQRRSSGDNDYFSCNRSNLKWPGQYTMKPMAGGGVELGMGDLHGESLLKDLHAKKLPRRENHGGDNDNFSCKSLRTNTSLTTTQVEIAEAQVKTFLSLSPRDVDLDLLATRKRRSLYGEILATGSSLLIREGLESGRLFRRCRQEKSSPPRRPLTCWQLESDDRCWSASPVTMLGRRRSSGEYLRLECFYANLKPIDGHSIPTRPHVKIGSQIGSHLTVANLKGGPAAFRLVVRCQDASSQDDRAFTVASIYRFISRRFIASQLCFIAHWLSHDSREPERPGQSRLANGRLVKTSAAVLMTRKDSLSKATRKRRHNNDRRRSAVKVHRDDPGFANRGDNFRHAKLLAKQSHSHGFTVNGEHASLATRADGDQRRGESLADDTSVRRRTATDGRISPRFYQQRLDRVETHGDARRLMATHEVPSAHGTSEAALQPSRIPRYQQRLPRDENLTVRHPHGWVRMAKRDDGWDGGAWRRFSQPAICYQLRLAPLEISATFLAAVMTRMLSTSPVAAAPPRQVVTDLLATEAGQGFQRHSSLNLTTKAHGRWLSGGEARRRVATYGEGRSTSHGALRRFTDRLRATDCHCASCALSVARRRTKHSVARRVRSTA
ncbi:unnamed protein product [Closterium sp. Yama58-4]|nr:unnamed protein product [Closterium sp. Yama58-4]